MPEQTRHQSVLLNEVLEGLGPIHGGCYLDATFGNGGYRRAILDTAHCTVLAIDRDPDAIKRGAAMKAEYASRVHLAEGCFSDMAGLVNSHLSEFRGLNGAAFDLGVCSTQLDQPERGFSFRADGPLDMRMSKTGQSAADIVMHTMRLISQVSSGNMAKKKQRVELQRPFAKNALKQTLPAPVSLPPSSTASCRPEDLARLTLQPEAFRLCAFLLTASWKS